MQLLSSPRGQLPISIAAALLAFLLVQGLKHLEGGCLGFKPDKRASADVLSVSLEKGKKKHVECAAVLSLEVSFLFLSSTAALILLSGAGGGSVCSGLRVVG